MHSEHILTNCHYCVWEYIIGRQNIFCPTNPIYGRAFALHGIHAHYVPAPLEGRGMMSDAIADGVSYQWRTFVGRHAAGRHVDVAEVTHARVSRRSAREKLALFKLVKLPHSHTHTAKYTGKLTSEQVS